jgi:hypothetical protein
VSLLAVLLAVGVPTLAWRIAAIRAAGSWLITRSGGWGQ